MFQLEQAISDWKESCQGSESVSAAAAAELETHLRDSVSRLQASGLDEEEAFIIATRRLGSPGDIQGEYRKVHHSQVWLGRIILMLTGYLLISLILKFIALDQATAGLIGLAMGWASTDTMFIANIPHHWSAILNASVGVVGVGLLIWFVISLARGPGNSFLSFNPESERRVFDALEKAPEKIGKLLAWWIGLYLVLSAGQVLLQMFSAKHVTVVEYSYYMASLTLYEQATRVITVVALLLATAVLCKRYRTLSGAIS